MTKRRFGELPPAERAGTYYLDKRGRARDGATHRSIPTEQAMRERVLIYSAAEADAASVAFGTPRNAPAVVANLDATPQLEAEAEPETARIEDDLPAAAEPAPEIEEMEPEPEPEPEPRGWFDDPKPEHPIDSDLEPEPEKRELGAPTVAEFDEPLAVELAPEVATAPPTVGAGTATIVATAYGTVITAMVARRTGAERRGLNENETKQLAAAWQQVLDKRAAKYIGEGDDLVALLGVTIMIASSRMQDEAETDEEPASEPAPSAPTFAGMGPP